MRRPRVTPAQGAAALVAVVLSCLTAHGIAGVQQPSSAPTVDLTAGMPPHVHDLGGGSALSIRVLLDANRFGRIVVDQRGVDVAVVVTDPDGRILADIDSPNSDVGPEQVVLVARPPGTYRLDVRSSPGTATGSVEIRIVEWRPATPDDDGRIDAQRAAGEARARRDERTAESQRAAVALYERAAGLWRRANEPLAEAFVQHAMGMVLGDIGEYQRALDAYDRALALYALVGDQRGRWSVLSSSGFVYGQLGEYQKSIDVYERALQVARDSGDRVDETRMLSNVATTYANLGDFRRALDLHGQVLERRRATNDRGGQAITLNNIAVCHEQLGDLAAALDYYQQSLALMPAVGNLYYTATTLNHLGVVYRELGQPEAALERLTQALDYRRTIGDGNGEAATLYEIARLERDQGHLEEARATIDRALSTVESLRGKLGSQQLRASYFATARRYFEFSVDLLMRLHATRPDAGFDALALRASEMARARSLLELLAEARADLRRDGDPALFAREEALRQQISDAADRQTRLLSRAHSPEAAAEAAGALEAATAEYERVAADIRRTNPRYAALADPVPSGLDEVRRELLDADSVLLEFSLGDERSYVWAVTQATLDSAVLPGRAEIAGEVRRFYALLTARSERPARETPAERQRRLEAAEAALPAAAEALSRMLLAPVAPHLRRPRLVVAVEDVLQYVPFGALPVPGGDASQALVVDHEVVVLPSASVGTALRLEVRVPADRALAVFADPVFSRDDPRVRSGPTSGAPAPPDASALEVRRSAEETGLSDLVRLRFSRIEADEIAKVADAARTHKALDFAATRALATSDEMARYRVLHFATHALVNSRHAELSGVVLSLVDEAGKDVNGFLRLYDIYNLRLRTDLVVLSACQTALGAEVKGEGLIGLTRGFMYAGAPRVVATLWQIDDRATAELMRRFYQGMFADGLRPAAALRAAQISMRAEARWRAPYFWAAFTIQGDWR